MVYTEDKYVELNGELVYRVRLRPKDNLDEVKVLYSTFSSINTHRSDITLRPSF